MSIKAYNATDLAARIATADEVALHDGEGAEYLSADEISLIVEALTLLANSPNDPS